jgi:KDO2-lipid IV(A) lauroyltransferase
VRVVLAGAGLLPLRWAQRLGDGLGTLIFWAVPSERRKALKSLEVAFPQQTLAERTELARKCLRHLGRCALEIACAGRIAPQLETFMEWPAEDRALMEAVLARKRGVVFVTGHIGNWELMGSRVARAGFPVRAVAKEMTDARMTAFADRFRLAGGVQSIWRGQPGAVKQILRALKDGELLTLLIDQDTRVQNLFVPFFGRLAATPRAAADFALRMEAPTMVAWCHRREDGGYRIQMREIPHPHTGDREQDAVALTAALTAQLEAAIRLEPAQWVWMHQRWKSRPDGER